MNYIITENRISELKTNFLDGYIDDNVSLLSPYILIHNTGRGEFELYEPFFEFDYSDGRLFINSDVKETFISLFGSNTSDADEFISDWFTNKFDVIVEFTA
jgi:hypothetical protein